MPEPLLEDPALWSERAPLLVKADLDPILPQVGRFRMLDGVLALGEGEAPTVGYKEIRGDDWWASDHLPGRPIFPGVLQCELAAQLSTVDIVKRQLATEGDEQVFVGFGGVDGARFRASVVPDGRLIVAARLEKGSRRMWRYSTQGWIGERLAFEATITGVRL